MRSYLSLIILTLNIYFGRFSKRKTIIATIQLERRQYLSPRDRPGGCYWMVSLSIYTILRRSPPSLWKYWYLALNLLPWISWAISPGVWSITSKLWSTSCATWIFGAEHLILKKLAHQKYSLAHQKHSPKSHNGFDCNSHGGCLPKQHPKPRFHPTSQPNTEWYWVP